jgi:drug/metabolite transporter (DMT)-like permease
MSQTDADLPPPVTAGHRQRLGYLFGFIGVASFSLTLPATRVAVDVRMLAAPAAAWAGFAYVSVVSMFLGFFAWYRGLAEGGIAAVGQVQLLQPFLTIFASALLLDERIDGATIVAAVLVIASIALGRRVK